MKNKGEENKAKILWESGNGDVVRTIVLARNQYGRHVLYIDFNTEDSARKFGERINSMFPKRTCKDALKATDDQLTESGYVQKYTEFASSPDRYVNKKTVILDNVPNVATVLRTLREVPFNLELENPKQSGLLATKANPSVVTSKSLGI